MKASVRFIFATIFLDALGIGLLIPVMPDVIRRFNDNPEFVNHYFGYFISVYALMQFVASPIIGSLSDQYGRRPVLLVSLLGAGLDYLLMAFAPSLWILFLGRIISGLSGASITAASSYMADISDDTNRSANFGMIGAAFGLGFVIGPAIGGFLGDLGSQAPFIVAAILNLANFAFGYFILPESLPPEKRRVIELKRLNPFSSLKKILKPSVISLLIWAYFLIFLAGQSHPTIWTLYTQYKFGWSSLEVGLSLSAVGVVFGFSQGFLTRVIAGRMGETRALVLGMSFCVIAYLAYGLVTEGWMIYVVLVMTCPGAIAGPTLQSLISRTVPSQEQGELQGSLISLAAFATILGPLIYTSLFSKFTTAGAPFVFAGMPYMAAASICAFAFILSVLNSRK